MTGTGSRPTTCRSRCPATPRRRSTAATCSTSTASGSAARRCRAWARSGGSRSPRARRGSDGAATIRCAGGRLEPPRPAALGAGTVVELRDLFHATPARLKFLKTERSETMAVTDAVRRLAMAEPGVAFTLRDVSDGGERVLFRADAADQPGRPSGRDPGPRVLGERDGARRGAGGLPSGRPCRAADLFARQRRPPIPLTSTVVRFGTGC